MFGEEGSLGVGKKDTNAGLQICGAWNSSWVPRVRGVGINGEGEIA